MFTLINPNLVVQSSDIFTTGIVYMPVGLASFAGALRKNNITCNVIDAFGQRPNQCWKEGAFLARGLRPAEVAAMIPDGSMAIVIYAINSSAYLSMKLMMQHIRRRFPEIPIIAMENTQAVTGPSLRHIKDSLHDAGFDYIITGEAEDRGIALLELLSKKAQKSEIAKIDGISLRDNGLTCYQPPQKTIDNLDGIAFPAWELFPLQNYWDLRYAHGPFETKRYLPLLTSRGCPYACTFCATPDMNNRSWRSCSAQNVVDQMQYCQSNFGVDEFHWEDLNPTVSEQRILDICTEIMRRKLKVIWKLVSGTKAETIRNESTLEIMSKAGCRYISISPESGSRRMLKRLDKQFDVEHAARLVKKMHELGMRSQACFLLGCPGEEEIDRRDTLKLVRYFTKLGIDEIAVFIITPMPGSRLFEDFNGYADYSELTFSPSWRSDYKELNKFRLSLYKNFIILKLLFHPKGLLQQPFNFLLRAFKTKMEMVPYRALHTIAIRAANHYS